MSTKLRPYQVDATDAIWHELATNDSTLLVMATGTGKSECLTEIVRRVQPGRVMVLAHREELIQQLRARIVINTGLDCEVEMAHMVAGEQFHNRAPVIVSTVQTQIAGMDGKGRMTRFDPNDFALLIIDECVTGDTLITLSNGTTERIDSIVERGVHVSVLSFNTSTNLVEPKRLYGAKKSVSKRIVTVRFCDGTTLRATPEHPVFTQRGYVAISCLTPNDFALRLKPHEQRTRTVDLRLTAWRCRHEPHWHLQVPSNDNQAFHKTNATGFGEIPHTPNVGGNAAEAGKKRWMGRPSNVVHYVDTKRVSSDLGAMLPKQEENCELGMAEQINTRRDGVVVHGRRKHKRGWSSNFNRVLQPARTLHNEAMVFRDSRPTRYHQTIEELSVPHWNEQAGRTQVQQSYPAIRLLRNAIQAIFWKVVNLLELWSGIHSEDSPFALLRRSAMPRRKPEEPIPRMVSEEPTQGSPAKQGAHCHQTETEELLHLRKGVCDRKDQETSLWNARMQEGEQGKNRQALVSEQSAARAESLGILSVTEETESISVFDIAVEDNHNYFANGVLVHNCHRAASPSYRKVIAYYQQNPFLKLLGVTATPDRADEKAMGEMFDTVAYDYPILDAINDGYLVPIEQQMVHIHGLDYSEIKTTAGDLNGGQLAQVMEAEEVLQGVASATIQIIGNKRAMIFTSSVKHAEMLSDILNRHREGMAGWASGETDKDERRALLKKFASGETQAVCNCGLWLEGYDLDSIDVVIMAKPTKSRIAYSQMIGRGTRTLKGVIDGHDTPEARKSAIAASNKKCLLVVDYSGNSGRHKLVTTADILGGKSSEEAIERAKQMVLKKEGACNMVQALADAEAELQKQRELREKRAQEEIARRAKLKATASYSTKQINPFDVFEVTPTPSRKWDEGKVLSEKQRNILIKSGVNPDGMPYHESKQILDETFRRWNKKLCSLKQAACLKRYGYDTKDMTMAAAKAALDALAKNNWKRPGGAPPPPKPPADPNVPF